MEKTMTSTQEMMQEVKEILSTDWDRRDGREVPEAEDIELGNDAVCLKGSVLYADMADSTSLVNGYKDWFAAEAYKAYLICACRIIRKNGGVITAFDGDRVMGVFIGETKNTSAAIAALQISYVVSNVVNKAIKELYPNSGFQVQQSVGIDTSDLFVARTGIRGSNDLVWVGRAANYAAKLCALREGSYTSFITEEVFNKLRDDAKYGGQPKQPMWEKRMWTEQGIAIYRSSWWWNPD
jgi:class 3 adenylate cyclase